MYQPGTLIPDFVLTNQDGETVRLSDFRGKNVVLFSFPGNTVDCAIQAATFQAVLSRFEATGTVVFGISGARAGALKVFKRQHRLQFDLLTDTRREFLSAWGAWGIRVLGLTLPLAQRSYLVVDEKGIVLECAVSVDAETSVEKTLKCVKLHTATRKAYRS